MKFIRKVSAIILTMLISILCISCNNTVKKLQVVSFVTGEIYTLDINTENIYAGGNYKTFTSNLDINEIKEIIENKYDYSCELFNNNYLLIEITKNNQNKDCLIIGKLHNTQSYQLMNSIVFDPVGQGFVLFPIYLLNKNAESMSSGEVYEFLTDNPYELTGTKEEIKEFYAKSGVYSVKEDANQLIIQVLNDSFTYNLSKDAFSICIEEQQDQVTVIINRVIE